MLKLTTDKHEASRGLSATAELLVINPSQYTRRWPTNNFIPNAACSSMLVGLRLRVTYDLRGTVVATVTGWMSLPPDTQYTMSQKNGPLRLI